MTINMTYTLKTTGLISILLLLMIIGCTEQAPSTATENNTITKSYIEKHRPQFHFTPEANWMNDPNGMFYYEGKYHLFYQYFPDSTVWGPMHWGHAESKDMVHWEHLPIGLYPDSIGCIFSGGAIVDINNTSKLGTAKNPPIVATFTHHDFVGEKAKTNDFQKQSIAYSVDGGYKWTKYKGNPVIPNTEKIKDFRDPKVVWHEDSKKWILVLAAYDRVKFYASSNLTDWNFISDYAIEGDNRLWECPDLFPMKVEGSNETKWVLIVSIQKEAPNDGTATSYFVGEFDGKEFKSDIKKQRWLDWGTDNYAFVTWNNVPKNDGRILGIGWMSNWQYAQVVPTEKWRSTMTLSRELTLHPINGDYQIYSSPVKEYQSLRGKPTALEAMSITKGKTLQGSFDPTQAEYDFNINLKKTTATSFGMKFENDLGEYFTIKFNIKEGKMYVDRTNSGNKEFSEKFYNSIHSAPISFDKEEMDLRLFMDAASAEIFIDNGALNFTSIFFPTKKFDKITLLVENGTLNLNKSTIYPLNSIWSNQK